MSSLGTRSELPRRSFYADVGNADDVITYPGHGMAEGVKPALVDSLAQALGVAPLFAFYEGLWFAGFAPDLKVGACRATPQNVNFFHMTHYDATQRFEPTSHTT